MASETEIYQTGVRIWRALPYPGLLRRLTLSAHVRHGIKMFSYVLERETLVIYYHRLQRLLYVAKNRLVLIKYIVEQGDANATLKKRRFRSYRSTAGTV